MQRNYFGVALTVLALAGCGVKFGGDEDSSDSDSFHSETTAVVLTEGSASETGGQPDPSGDPPPDGTTDVGPSETTDAQGTTASDEDSATVTTEVPDGTTGAPEPSACELMCDHAAECGLSNDAVVCAELCEDAFEGDDQVCEDATTAMLWCFAGLSCEHLAVALDGEFGHPCNVAQNDKQVACGPPECAYGAGGDFEGGWCFIEISCGPVHKMECDTETCVCTVDGEQTGTCPADGICKDINAQDDKAVECCGFPQVEL